MAQKWPHRRDVLHKVARTAEHQRQDDIALGEGGDASALGGTLTWHLLTDIFTPREGVRPKPAFGSGDELAFYALDEDFLYLKGDLEINFTTGFVDHHVIDQSDAPIYYLGDFGDLPGDAPAAAMSGSADNSWFGVTLLDGGADPQPLFAQFFVELPNSPARIRIPDDAHAIDDYALPVFCSLDTVRLPWGNRGT